VVVCVVKNERSVGSLDIRQEPRRIREEFLATFLAAKSDPYSAIVDKDIFINRLGDSHRAQIVYGRGRQAGAGKNEYRDKEADPHERAA
ncbi:MAG TPA: hypothetical protein VN285_04915, partial [Candidatus Deferrimicrobium sp.]|nr:hypothetical protein [Candidatus Deferrimicrobium sp.]